MADVGILMIEQNAEACLDVVDGVVALAHELVGRSSWARHGAQEILPLDGVSMMLHPRNTALLRGPDAGRKLGSRGSACEAAWLGTAQL